MHNLAPAAPFNNGNYFNDISMTREKAVETLSSFPMESWLVRPSSQGGSCITYMTSDAQIKKTFMHILPDDSSTDSLNAKIRNFRLVNENYVGPAELHFREEQPSLATRVVNEKDERLIPVMAKAWLKTIKSDRQEIVAHCRKHPGDCRIFYEGLDEIAKKIPALIAKGATKLMQRDKMELLAEQAKNTADVFRALERSVTICGMTRDDAVLNAPLVCSGGLRIPSEIRSYIYTLMITCTNNKHYLDLSEESLNRLRSLFKGANREGLYQLLGEAISHFGTPVNSFDHLTEEEKKGITPYLTSLGMHVDSGHFESVPLSKRLLFKKYLGECDHITHVTTSFFEDLKDLKHKEKLTHLEAFICSTTLTGLKPIDFDYISTLPALKQLKINKTFHGHWSSELMQKIRSNSVTTLEFGRTYEPFTMSKEMVGQWLENLPMLKEIIVHKTSCFTIDDGVAALLANKNIQLTQLG